MRCIEADGKQVLKSAGLSVPASAWITFADQDVPDVDWSHAWFLKAQALAGHRGHGGLVRLCETRDACREALIAIRTMLGSTPCAGWLLEAAMPFDEAWLVSCDVDRREGCLRVSWSHEGGGDVMHVQSRSVADAQECLSLPVKDPVRDVLRVLVETCVREDALRLEVNPLGVLTDGSFCVLDAKMELDDAALTRHMDRSWLHVLSPLGRPHTGREERYAAWAASQGHRGTIGQYLELDGDIAMILSGGGASLVAMDALLRAGGKPANYVELSGNPEPTAVREAAEIVLQKPGLRAVWIAGSFANFTDIAATVLPVLEAMDTLSLCVPIVIRRDGPSADAAEQAAYAWARDRGVRLFFHRGNIDLAESARLVTQHVV